LQINHRPFAKPKLGLEGLFLANLIDSGINAQTSVNQGSAGYLPSKDLFQFGLGSALPRTMFLHFNRRPNEGSKWSTIYLQKSTIYLQSTLAVVSVDSFLAPALIARAGPRTRKKFFEFFTVPIRNANTRAAYYRAIQQFLAWVERAGYQHLEDIEPITVADYIETLQRQAAPPTVKQHMAAIRMLFSWLTEKGVLAMNPAREVKTERFSRTEGKTPAFVDGEVQRLLDAVETSTVGLDCAPGTVSTVH
jgi:hypothetical protein